MAAIRLYARRGRKKEYLNGKLRGGNEFISNHIMAVTGEVRCRKQVSSHSQVERAFMADNPECQYCGLVILFLELNSLGLRLINAVEDKNSGDNNDCDDKDPSCRESSRFHDLASHQRSQETDRMYYATLTLPTQTLSSNALNGPTIHRVEFAMNVFDLKKDTALHNYTSIQTQIGSAPKALDDVRHWHQDFPDLAGILEQGKLDSPIYLFETTLRLMDALPNCKSGLRIELSVDMTQGTNFYKWQSLTKFYEEHGNWLDLSEYCEKFQSGNCPWDTVEWRQVPNTSDSRLIIPLKSKWWVQAFAYLIEEKTRMTHNGESNGDQDEYARRYLEGVSIMQELYATSPTPGSRPQRMAILIWKFKQTRHGEVATTTWRRIVPPMPSFQIQSPLAPQMQPPMSLDSAVQEDVAPLSANIFSDYYNPQPSMLTDSSENFLAVPQTEETSPTSTPTAEDRSFPSSTSDSFLSSMSNSTYPLHLSQESSFHTQDLAYPGLESYDSQGFASQESYLSQDNMYRSQDSLYARISTPLYEYPNLQSLHGEHMEPAETSQDFTGGEIQLSYRLHKSEPHTYGTPLVAPKAKIMTQHQLIDNLEQFGRQDEHQDLYDHESDQQHGQLDFTQWQTAAGEQSAMWANMNFDHVEYQYTGDMITQLRGAVDEGESSMEVQGQVLGEIREEGGLLDSRFEHQ